MRVLNNKELDRMIKNGWMLMTKKGLETDGIFQQELEKHYSKIKFYHRTTSVKGYYSTIAMVKR